MPIKRRRVRSLSVETQFPSFLLPQWNVHTHTHQRDSVVLVYVHFATMNLFFFFHSEKKKKVLLLLTCRTLRVLHDITKGLSHTSTWVNYHKQKRSVSRHGLRSRKSEPSISVGGSKQRAKMMTVINIQTQLTQGASS